MRLEASIDDLNNKAWKASWAYNMEIESKIQNTKKTQLRGCGVKKEAEENEGDGEGRRSMNANGYIVQS